MQIFSCPFCGPRPEYEFHFGGDQGNDRPEGFDQVPAREWAEYLNYRNNLRGEAHEIWMHLACGELFSMRRDSVSMTAEPGVALQLQGERT